MKVKDYYGTRARIGLIYISSSTVMEPEFYAMAPEGVSVNTTRMHLPEVTVKSLRGIMDGDEVEKCTRELARAPLHSICFGGTSATFIEGIGWDEKVCARMNGASNGIPCTTTSTAMLKALKAVGAKKVSFVTPYLDEVTERGRIFLEQNGFTVVSSRGLNIKEDQGIGAVTTQRTYDFALETAKPEADAVFISCTNFRTIGAIAPLEEKLKKPVVSSIQASFWHCLKLASTVPTSEVKGFGRLFQA